MPVAFDAGAAETLVRAALRAAEELRAQGPRRRAEAERAARSFSGPHARMFDLACTVEAEDRGLLAGVLAELAAQVAAAQASAEQENHREQQRAEWELRNDARALRQTAGAVPSLGPGRNWGQMIYDPRPADPLSVGPTVAASFLARQRQRGRGQRSSAPSSAVPRDLGTFSERSAELNAALERELQLVWEGWTRFVQASPWVRIDSATFLVGFQAFLAENEADARWIARVATAFRAAGDLPLSQVVLSRFPVARPRTLGSAEVLQRLADLSDRDLAAWLAAAPGVPAQLQQVSPRRVAQWWAALGDGEGAGGPSPRQELLLREYPEMLSGLDGLPVNARVQANSSRARALLSLARADLDQAERGERRYRESRMTFLRNEISYLERVEAGRTQLYLYDRDRSRIVEVLGAVNSGTERAITYVPGTYTGLDSFYRGGVQQVGQYLTQHLPGTVAFIYKDGEFPGEERASRAPRALRIREANDPGTAREAGQQLRRFERGIRADPELSTLPQTGIGHSWGLASLTASEVAGSRYDTVLSLSGAGMVPEWRPNPRTGYLDFTYPDLLQGAQIRGYVWGGNTPRSNQAFAKMPPYRGPRDGVFESPGLRDTARKLGALTDNHNLIATADPANQRVLEDLRRVLEE